MKRCLLLLPLLTVLLAADRSERSTESLLHAGDLAISESRWDDADKLYAEALERSHDPSLVAFNRATAMAKAKRYDEAERLYFQALEDVEAPDARRANSLYNRGVCLIYKGGAQHLRTAIDSLDRSIRSGHLEPQTLSDAKHNLELAKVLWLEARAKLAEKPQPSEAPKDTQLEPKPKEPKSKPENEPTTNPNDPNGTTNPQDTRIDPISGQPKPDGPKTTTNKTVGGKGNLPVVIDDSWRPNNDEDAKAYLERLAARLTKERRISRDTLAPTERSNVKNW